MAKFHANEFEPPRQGVELVVEKVVIPQIERLTDSADHSLAVDIELHVGPRLVTSLRTVMIAIPKARDRTSGTAQLRFRPGFHQNRLLYCLAVRFDGEVLTNSGFTGFNTSGGLRDLEIAETHGWTGIYNDRSWPGWRW